LRVIVPLLGAALEWQRQFLATSSLAKPAVYWFYGSSNPIPPHADNSSIICLMRSVQAIAIVPKLRVETPSVALLRPSSQDAPESGSSGLTMQGQDPGSLKPSHTNAYKA
jgi:hypothetical protein